MKPPAVRAALVLAALGFVSLYEAKQLRDLRHALAAEERHREEFQRELNDAVRQREEAARDLTLAREKLLEAQRGEADSASTSREAVHRWAARVRNLQASFDEQPGQRIPELQLLSELDWFSVADQVDGASEGDQRKARSLARNAAIAKFAPLLRAALRAYVEANHGNLPPDTGSLLPFFATSIDPAILGRYEMFGSGDASAHQTGGLNSIGLRTPIDGDYDWRYLIRTDGGYSGPWGAALLFEARNAALKGYKTAHGGQSPPHDFESLVPYVSDPQMRIFFEASGQFQKAHNGQRPAGSADLLPYVHDALARMELERMIRQETNIPPAW